MTVMFVEQTKGGVLASRLRLVEERLSKVRGWKAKIVEKGGKTLGHQLCKPNLWVPGDCGRDGCVPCKSGDAKSDCFKTNILYENTCLACLSKSRTRVYVGESNRSAFQRGGEHMRDFLSEKIDSHMHKHSELEHHDDITKPKFQFRTVRTFRSALARQVAEAVRIRRRGGDVINSKGVYNRCKLPRLVVEQELSQPDQPEQQEGNQVTPEDQGKTWRRTGRRRMREKDDDDDHSTGTAKRMRRSDDFEDWGCKPIELKEIESQLDCTKWHPHLPRPVQTKPLKQTLIRLTSEPEIVVKYVINTILERTGYLAELFNAEAVAEEAIISYGYSRVESGVGVVVDSLVENAVARAEQTRMNSGADILMRCVMNKAMAVAILRAKPAIKPAKQPTLKDMWADNQGVYEWAKTLVKCTVSQAVARARLRKRKLKREIFQLVGEIAMRAVGRAEQRERDVESEVGAVSKLKKSGLIQPKIAEILRRNQEGATKTVQGGDRNFPNSIENLSKSKTFQSKIFESQSDDNSSKRKRKSKLNSTQSSKKYRVQLKQPNLVPSSVGGWGGGGSKRKRQNISIYSDEDQDKGPKRIRRDGGSKNIISSYFVSQAKVITGPGRESLGQPGVINRA